MLVNFGKHFFYTFALKSIILKYYSNGKLLITGEYIVLDGAKSFALPTKYGQNLIVDNYENKILKWKSFNIHNKIWFDCDIELPSLKLIRTSDNKIAKTLINILIEAKNINNNFLNSSKGLLVKTNLNFEQNWGLGTSSTLINNIASWAQVDAFNLQFKIFGGSAYDIACAQNDKPIVYQLKNGTPKTETIDFNPEFKNNLFFIHLNKKQNSRDAIKSYKENKIDKTQLIFEISDITNQIISANSLSKFKNLIKIHEKLISKVIGIEPIKKRLFKDYSGEIKSLGAWGGDFILAAGDDNTIEYFNKKGFKTVIPYNKIIL